MEKEDNEEDEEIDEREEGSVLFGNLVLEKRGREKAIRYLWEVEVEVGGV